MGMFDRGQPTEVPYHIDTSDLLKETMAVLVLSFIAAQFIRVLLGGREDAFMNTLPLVAAVTFGYYKLRQGKPDGWMRHVLARGLKVKPVQVFPSTPTSLRR